MNESKEGEVMEFKLSVPMLPAKKLDVVNAESIAAEEISDPNSNRAVALIGDRFYQGRFLPAAELEKAYTGWENTLHDINHMGTTQLRGLGVTSDIRFFVGYNTNVSYDLTTKSVSMNINIDENTMYGKAWKAYVALCEKAGQVPNVSVNFNAKFRKVQAKELPKGVNYTEYGIKSTDYVDYIYNIEPRALSTVFKGACSDAAGCGIGKCSCETNHADDESTQDTQEDSEKRQELIKWLEEHIKGE